MHWESFAVRFEPGQSVFDGLRWIRSHRHPTLAEKPAASVPLDLAA